MYTFVDHPEIEINDESHNDPNNNNLFTSIRFKVQSRIVRDLKGNL